MESPKLWSKWNEKLETNIFMRDKVKADEVCYDDVFEHQFHVLDLDPAPQTILDLGCNIGLTMVDYHWRWPKAWIHGYEMDPENAQVASFNTFHPVHNEAIWTGSAGVAYEKGRDSEQCYRIVRDEPFIRSFYEETGWCYNKSVTLDIAINRLMQNNGMVDFVKMDIEGAEMEVLKSNGAWQHRIKNLLVEVHGDTDEDTPKNFEIVKRILRYKGFKVRDHKPHWSAIHAWKTIS